LYQSSDGNSVGKISILHVKKDKDGLSMIVKRRKKT
jgi:hypothetical protein